MRSISFDVYHAELHRAALDPVRRSSLLALVLIRLEVDEAFLDVLGNLAALKEMVPLEVANGLVHKRDAFGIYNSSSRSAVGWKMRAVTTTQADSSWRWFGPRAPFGDIYRSSGEYFNLLSE